MIRWTAVAGIYGLLGLAAGYGAYSWHESPWRFQEPWLELPPLGAHGYSAVLGLTFGLLVVLATRVLVARARFARTLQAELRPWATGLPGEAIVVLAVFSAFGEELLFRSLIQPATGLVLQALVFGVAHQLPGRARFIWMAWATVMGLCLGSLFALTGSLVGPILAHALINAMNLRFLQAPDAAPPRRGLGGLLGSAHPR